jgi:hypothetical protein
MPWKNEWSKMDFGEKVIIWMIGIEILLGLGGLYLTVHEGNTQDVVLGKLLAAQQNVDHDLSSMDEKLNTLNQDIGTVATSVSESAKTSLKINQTLGAQLKIIAEEQKQRSEELARRPIMEATIGDVSFKSVGSNVIPKEITDTRSVWEIVIHNNGTQPLIAGIVRFAADNPDITMTTQNSFQTINVPSQIAKTGTGIQMVLSRLGQGTWMEVLLTTNYSKGTKPFNVTISIDGDNLPITILGTLTVKPPI